MADAGRLFQGRPPEPDDKFQLGDSIEPPGHSLRCLASQREVDIANRVLSMMRHYSAFANVHQPNTGSVVEAANELEPQHIEALRLMENNGHVVFEDAAPELLGDDWRSILGRLARLDLVVAPTAYDTSFGIPRHFKLTNAGLAAALTEGGAGSDA